MVDITRIIYLFLNSIRVKTVFSDTTDFTFEGINNIAEVVAKENNMHFSELQHENKLKKLYF